MLFSYIFIILIAQAVGTGASPVFLKREDAALGSYGSAGFGSNRSGGGNLGAEESGASIGLITNFDVEEFTLQGRAGLGGGLGGDVSSRLLGGLLSGSSGRSGLFGGLLGGEILLQCEDDTHSHTASAPQLGDGGEIELGNVQALLDLASLDGGVFSVGALAPGRVSEGLSAEVEFKREGAVPTHQARELDGKDADLRHEWAFDRLFKYD